MTSSLKTLTDGGGRLVINPINIGAGGTTTQTGLKIGVDSICRHDEGLTIGYGSVTGSPHTEKNYGISLGSGAYCRGDSGIAIGYGGQADGDMGISIGRSSGAMSEDSIGIGSNAFCGGVRALAFGRFANTYSSGSIVMGQGASIGASAGEAVAIGSSASIGEGAQYSIALGHNASVTGSRSVAIGNSVDVTNDDEIVIGRDDTKVVAPGTFVNGGLPSQAFFYGIGINSQNFTGTSGTQDFLQGSSGPTSTEMGILTAVSNVSVTVSGVSHNMTILKNLTGHTRAGIICYEYVADTHNTDQRMSASLVKYEGDNVIELAKTTNQSVSAITDDTVSDGRTVSVRGTTVVVMAHGDGIGMLRFMNANRTIYHAYISGLIF